MDSELDKRDQAYKKEMEIKASVLKKFIEHDTKRSITDFELFKEILKSSSSETRDFDILKDLVDKTKLRESEPNEKDT